MKRAICCFAALTAILLVGTQANADPFGVSIGINFGADEPPGIGSPVNGAAGVLGSVNWNNLSGANGAVNDLFADAASTMVPVGASVSWTSPNTWSSTGRAGEENNTAPPGPDRNLMSGYIDTTDQPAGVATVNVSNLPAEFSTFGYDVLVYINGGVINRFGDYTIGGITQIATDSVPFDGTYTQGENFLLFENVNTPGGFTLISQAMPTAAGGGFRAPINAIEILAHPIPEPSSMILAGLGAGGLLAIRAWRRRKAPS